MAARVAAYVAARVAWRRDGARGGVRDVGHWRTNDLQLFTRYDATPARMHSDAATATDAINSGSDTTRPNSLRASVGFSRAPTGALRDDEQEIAPASGDDTKITLSGFGGVRFAARYSPSIAVRIADRSASSPSRCN